MTTIPNISLLLTNGFEYDEYDNDVKKTMDAQKRQKNVYQKMNKNIAALQNEYFGHRKIKLNKILKGNYVTWVTLELSPCFRATALIWARGTLKL